MIAHKDWIKDTTLFGIAGAPGSGKGTITDRLGQRGIRVVSTSGELAKEIERGSDVGLTARSFIQRHEMVPDSIVLELISSKIQELHQIGHRTFCIDSLPRTIGQVETVHELFGGEFPIFFNEVDDEEAIKRMLARGREKTREECELRLRVFKRDTLPALMRYERVFPKSFFRVNTMEYRPCQCVRFVENKVKDLVRCKLMGG